MAIFGHLSDLPFPEIFNMLGRRTGHLALTGPDCGDDLILHLENGQLRGVQVGGTLVDDDMQVRDRLLGLMEASDGQFEFQRQDSSEILGKLSLSMPRLLMSVASAVDEIGAFRERFSHPRTRFRVAADQEIWLDDELYDFLQRARPLLEGGIDAEALALELGLRIERVQLYLYKLRAVGKVAPVRAADVALARPWPAGPPSAVTASAAAPPPLPAAARDDREEGLGQLGTGIFQRLLRAVRERVYAT